MAHAIRRSSQERVLAGVLGGLAEHWELDPTRVRAAFVLLAIFSAAFPGILVYLALWIAVPSDA